MTSPPNALLPTEEQIAHVRKAIQDEMNRSGPIASEKVARAALSAMRALAKPDEGVVARAAALVDAMKDDVDRQPVSGAWDRLRIALLPYRASIGAS